MTSTAGDRAAGPDEAPLSPAERYARAAARSKALTGPLGASGRQYPFELDDFQLRACEALEDGRGVLVAAPTGSGKTVVGEFAVHLALPTGRKALLHDADQGAVEPEVRRPGRAATAPDGSACSPATTRSTARRRSSS